MLLRQTVKTDQNGQMPISLGAQVILLVLLDSG